MSARSKRSWKLQEFVAHGAPVNCLALGHRSGRVLVTGGEDKKVNLWAVGKPNCIMSLTGHSTPIACVRFGHTEEHVCAGSHSGALKIWDLEAARLVRTHTGHKAGISCIEFHPYGEYLASGSDDTCLKLWDTRRKGCIFSYKGHTNRVNSLKFSPDGQWIASAGEEGHVKLWDLRAGKLLNEFKMGSAPVTDVEFHPHEFLLAGGCKDRSVSFWDLEKFQCIGNSERETGPIKCIYFHPEGDCLFTGTQDNLNVHGWEPSRSFDTLYMNWGRVSDIAVASQQLIGASYLNAHVSIFVVDLKKVQPFCGVNIPEKEQKPSKDEANVAFRPGQSVRRSFIREKPEAGKKPTTQVKISEETSDKSGTEGEDSDAVTAHADIPDVTNYENVFRPRKRELNRTPPPAEPFEEPSSSDHDMPLPVRAVDPMNFHATKLSNKKVSPSPTRRASQPAIPSGYHTGARRGSVSGGGSAGTASGDVMKPQEVHMRNNNTSNSGPARPTSVYDGAGTAGSNGGGRTSSQSVPRDLPSSPVRASYRTSVNLQQCKDSPTEQEYLPGVPEMQPPFVPYGAVNSPVNQKGSTSPTKPVNSPTPYNTSLPYLGANTPLDRPTAVRPLRTSESTGGSGNASYNNLPTPPPTQQQQQSRHDPPQKQQPPAPQQKIELVPNISDKPTGLSASDFLPQKFGGLQIGLQPSGGGSKLAYDHWPQNQYSESEVTSSILKDHTNIMAVITQRSRNIGIIRQLWHSKDAKTAVEQAVQFQDSAVVVDLLSVIILRPSIWNLDLCLLLLPPIGELLHSKYESYVNAATGALKLVLKNFGTVIKSNIDTPGNSVGVDISKEERLNKCMDCYQELVKIRSTVLKRQNIQGKVGHTFRELAILMQCLD